MHRLRLLRRHLPLRHLAADPDVSVNIGGRDETATFLTGFMGNKYDGVVKTSHLLAYVIPAKAGIQ
jgi:hypothetical protein